MDYRLVSYIFFYKFTDMNIILISNSVLFRTGGKSITFKTFDYS